MKYLGWIIALGLGILLVSNLHTNKSQDLLYQKVLFPNGNYAYKINIGVYHIIEVGVKDNGELNYFINYPPDHEQMISFFSNGVIQSKIKKDENGITQGNAYYFYRETGNLSSEYFYKNGIKTGSAVSYHDSSRRVKEFMLYNENGELFYRKTFDEQGSLLKEEGSRY